MPDIASINAVLTSIKTATDIAKWFRETDLSLEKAEAKLKLAELMSSLADAKVSMAETQALLEKKDREIKALQEALEVKKKLVRYRDSYYESDESRNPTGDPYCSKCWEVDHKLVHINQHPQNRANSVCPACKNIYRWQGRITPGEQA